MVRGIPAAEDGVSPGPFPPNMKPQQALLTFAAGIFCGLSGLYTLLTFLGPTKLFPFLDSPSQDSEFGNPFAGLVDDMTRQLDFTREENRKLQERVRELEAQAAARPVMAAPAPTMTPPGPPPNMTPPPLPANLREMARQAQARRTEGLILQLKSRLNLTPGQEELVREILAAQPAGPGTGPFSAALPLSPGNPLREALTPVLSPDQMAALDTFAAEQRQNQVELMATGQMMQLQSIVTLSEEQKNRAFEQFARIAAETINPTAGAPSSAPSGGPVAADPVSRLEQNLSALEGILSPEQMEIYRGTLESQQQMFRQFRGAAGPGAPGTGPAIDVMVIEGSPAAPPAQPAPPPQP